MYGPVIKVWITKYALSKGILEFNAEPNGDMTYIRALNERFGFETYYHGEGREWHRSEDEARARANRMVRDKINSTRRQLARLEKLKF